MSLTEFNELPNFKQVELLWNSAPIIQTVDNEIAYVLYSLKDFFVEVAFDLKKNDDYYTYAFKDLSYLANYLDRIKLDLVI